MWQVLLAAAVAGSGILAKRLIKNSNADEPISDPNQNDPDISSESLQPRDSIFLGNDGVQENICQEEQNDATIFRFSSTCRKEMGGKNARKKTGVSSRKTEFLKKNSNEKSEKKCGVFGCEKRGWVVDQRGSGVGKRVSVCLKKRRTSKIASGQCPSCTSKGNSLFSWGLGVGIMYMMSTGKVEINKLNNAMDETSKIVQELKAELSRRKTLPNLYTSQHIPTKLEMQPRNNRQILVESVVKKSTSERSDAVKVFAVPIVEEAECSSSVLTEEHLPEVFEMDQLEAELETEFLKFPWCADAFENKDSTREFPLTDDQNMYSHHQQSNGVLPSELDQKLCHLLIEQQESQIEELESELQQTHSKLYEKEAELQTLKDCVRRLTEFSLGTASDEETDEKASPKNQWKEMGAQSGRSMVSIGMKRAMDFEPYN